MALRKNVVKPKVSPNPGSTLGLRKLMAGAPSRRAVHDQHRPAAAVEERREALGEALEIGAADDEHLAGRFREAPRQLLRHLAEAQLGAHIEPVQRVRLRARIQQAPYPARAARGASVLGKNADI